MNKRRIFQNPKGNKKASIKTGLNDGRHTGAWRRRVIDFYQSIIPSFRDISYQIWLVTPQDVADFYEKLKTDEYDFSLIEYVCMCETIADVYDIIDFLTLLRKKIPDDVKFIYLNFNWKLVPLFLIAGRFGFSRRRKFGDFYSESDLDCFFDMAGWENIKRIKRYMLPIKIPVLGLFFDNFLVRLPLFNHLALNTFYIARKSYRRSDLDHSVSVIIPCKNEETNIEPILERMPIFGKSLELVFINDASSDGTEDKIKNAQNKSCDKSIKLVQGKGEGKGIAVREGMKAASGDICMIMDADLTVIPEDLPQFYQAMKMRRADFIHGTRLVYAQEHGAFRFANILGNKAFSLLFSYILDQHTSDTLCGTKVFWRHDWPLFEDMRKKLGDRDIWGDYNLIFGASRYGLKIAQLPVRYFERLEGVTKMSKRFQNGIVMLRVAWHALWKVK